MYVTNEPNYYRRRNKREHDNTKITTRGQHVYFFLRKKTTKTKSQAYFGHSRPCSVTSRLQRSADKGGFAVIVTVMRAADKSSPYGVARRRLGRRSGPPPSPRPPSPLSPRPTAPAAAFLVDVLVVAVVAYGPPSRRRHSRRTCRPDVRPPSGPAACPGASVPAVDAYLPSPVRPSGRRRSRADDGDDAVLRPGARAGRRSPGARDDADACPTVVATRAPPPPSVRSVSSTPSDPRRRGATGRDALPANSGAGRPTRSDPTAAVPRRPASIPRRPMSPWSADGKCFAAMASTLPEIFSSRTTAERKSSTRNAKRFSERLTKYRGVSSR